jgi:hypothetical protein
MELWRNRGWSEKLGYEHREQRFFVILTCPLKYLTISQGKAQISTELTINANEFDNYSIHTPPITIAFHLREFSVCKYCCLEKLVTESLGAGYNFIC